MPESTCSLFCLIGIFMWFRGRVSGYLESLNLLWWWSSWVDKLWIISSWSYWLLRLKCMLELFTNPSTALNTCSAWLFLHYSLDFLYYPNPISDIRLDEDNVSYIALIDCDQSTYIDMWLGDYGFKEYCLRSSHNCNRWLADWIIDCNVLCILSYGINNLMWILKQETMWWICSL